MTRVVDRTAPSRGRRALPTPSPARGRARPAVLWAAAALLLGPAAGPALAHDALESSAPADGEVLTTAPTEFVLTFGADQLSLGTALAVTGPDGTDHAVGPAEVDGAVVTQTVDPPVTAGDYTVQWRSVSADGHPISGTLGFTVQAAVAPSSSTRPTTESSERPASGTASPAPLSAGAGGAADQSVDLSATSEDDPAGGVRDAGLLALVGGVVAAVAIAAVLVLRRGGVPR